MPTRGSAYLLLRRDYGMKTQICQEVLLDEPTLSEVSGFGDPSHRRIK